MITARHRNTSLLVAGCFFMEMLDGTIVTTATPQIGKSLHATPASVGLVVTAYLLTLAVLIPLSGWLTRRYGNRVIFLSAIAVFTLASVGCASSTSLGMLVGMRVLQGAGGAMMVPVGRNMVISMADKQDLLTVTSYVVWPGLIAPVIAPLAGGFITTYASWHWMFLINVPLGIAAFAVAWRLIQDLPGTGVSVPLDWLGVLLTCAGLGGLTYTAHLAALARPPVAPTAACAAGAALLLAGAVWHLRRAPHPLLNLRTLRVHTFRVTQVGGTMYYLVCGAMPFLLPLEFQTGFGWSPVKSGAVTLFVFVGNVGIKPATTPLINRFGFRAYLIASTIGTVVVVALLGLVTGGTPLALIALLAVAQGVFRSTGMTAYNTMGFADTPPGDMRDASTLLATSQQLATGLAVAVATVFLRIGSSWDNNDGSGRAAFLTAFLLLAAIAVGPAIEAARLRGDAGDAARQRSPAGAGRGTPGPVAAAPAAGMARADGAGSGRAAPRG
ncbi:MAG TPA: MFS transporter [Trebonia sp.]|nr:MFS transporter [Trebonia sp.]